tara:strand:+ start:467 stop:742 length:276 start_codon:yes stop_codon:yes gene_type:complete
VLVVHIVVIQVMETYIITTVDLHGSTAQACAKYVLIQVDTALTIYKRLITVCRVDVGLGLHGVSSITQLAGAGVSVQRIIALITLVLHADA